MVFDADPEFDFLHIDGSLTLPRFFLSFLLFIEILAVIHDPADRRFGFGSDFHQVQVFFFGQVQGIVQGHDTKLFPVRRVDTNFSCADGFIDPQFIFCYDVHLQ